MLTSWSSPKYWNLIDLGYVQTVTTQPSIGLICMNTSKASTYRLDTIVNIAKSLFQVAMLWGVICTNITGSDLSFALNRGKVAPKISQFEVWMLDNPMQNKILFKTLFFLFIKKVDFNIALMYDNNSSPFWSSWTKKVVFLQPIVDLTLFAWHCNCC